MHMNAQVALHFLSAHAGACIYGTNSTTGRKLKQLKHSNLLS